jgi:hypothetical protein
MNPFTLLKNAVKAVPAIKYALGVAGVASVVAIVLGLKLKPEIAVFGSLTVIGLMFVLVVFAGFAREQTNAIMWPAKVLVWFYTIAVIVTTTLFITSYFWQSPMSFQKNPGGGLDTTHSAPPATGDPIPVTLTAVYRGSLKPVNQTIFTVRDSHQTIVQETLPVHDGTASFELPPGEYELEALEAEGKLKFAVLPPKTEITIQIEPRESGFPGALVASESLSVSTGSSKSAFEGHVVVSLIANTMTDNPPRRKVSFTVGTKGRKAHTYELQDVGWASEIDGFDIRLMEIQDWGAKFLIGDERHVPGTKPVQ